MLPLGFVNVHVTSLKGLQKLMIFWLKPLWLAHFSSGTYYHYTFDKVNIIFIRKLTIQKKC